ncbi:Repressor of rna polymerase iii transcription maf1-like protein [Thalictrum thalictroides]|uniref:Repressor of RNA polymerase III transcription n=1 Tax=Thalictrum thalictroides TaxID=46969 RepID=A0A7J6VLY3_THATH|nr:Repressor of rna polymerase iii transcription maf1-like protein [Thalictrum thalictroides]
MKFLDIVPFQSINNFLNHVCVGECAIQGKIEAYSCKHAGTDKKLSLSLEHEILDYLGRSSDSDPSSPFQFLSTRSSRKTLIYLILTLNQIYPDYDFSAVQAQNFFREEVWNSFKQIFETYLFETSKEWSEANGGSSFLENLYKILDEVIKLPECEIYSFNPDSDGDPFMEQGAIWSFSFFFYNRKLKRVVSFRCWCLSNLAADGFLTAGPYEEEDGDIFNDMDM